MKMQLSIYGQTLAVMQQEERENKLQFHDENHRTQTYAKRRIRNDRAHGIRRALELMVQYESTCLQEPKAPYERIVADKNRCLN